MSRQPRPLASEPSRAVSPYLTAKEAAIYLRYASVRALYKAVRTHRMPVRYRGASLLFHRDDLDRWLTRHEPQSDAATILTLAKGLR